MSEEKHWLEPPKWWKKVKPLRIAAIGGVIFMLVSTFYVADKVLAPAEHPEARRFTELAAEPVLFFEGIYSYETLARVTSRFDAAKVTYTVQQSNAAPSGKYPPRDRSTVEVSPYTHLGEKTQLTLEFFNDRLYEAALVPEDPGAYAPKLSTADRRFKADRTGRAETVNGHLRLASNVAFAATDVGRNLRTRPYVIWQDLRLVQQLDEWDRRFVAIPQKN